MASLEWWAKSNVDQATPEPCNSGTWLLCGEGVGGPFGHVIYKVTWWGLW